jgi:NDP-hexose-3-ketoreductase
VRNGLTVGVHAWALTTGGETLDLSVGFDQHYECFYEVLGERGVIRLDRAYTPPADLRNTVVLSAAGGRTEVPVPAADQFQLMLDHVIAQAASADGREALYRQAVAVARGAELVRASCQEVVVP